jgi:hypothetical protein
MVETGLQGDPLAPAAAAGMSNNLRPASIPD